MTSDFAVVFPGQGSQFPGMGKDLHDAFEEARRVFDEVGSVLGRNMAHLCFEAPRETLDATIHTQTAVFTVNMAAFTVFAARVGARPRFMAGHSLGEYAALAAADVLPLGGCASLVLARATCMQEAVPAGEGAMAAIMGLEASEVERLCRTVAGGQAWPANYNGPGQTVVSGAAAAVQDVMARAKGAGGRAVLLPISVPCHCEMLNPAARRFETDLERQAFRGGSVPIIPNCDPTVLHGEGHPSRELLARQLTAPVRWHETVERMVSSGVTTFVEVGPKKTLSGLIRRIAPDVRILTVEDRASLEETAETL